MSSFLHDDTWLHTIWGGFLSSIVGAVVALGVVLFTVHHQKIGTAKQLSAQAEGLAQQLRAQAEGLAKQLAEQRSENAKDREHAAGADILRALQRLTRIMFEDRAQTANGPTQTCLAELRGGFERLRLELNAGDDAVISELHTWATLIQVTGYTLHARVTESNSAPSEGTDDKIMRDQSVIAFSSDFLMAHVAGYIRSGTEERSKIAGFLRQARKDLAEYSDVEEWGAKYFSPSERPYATVPDVSEPAI